MSNALSFLELIRQSFLVIFLFKIYILTHAEAWEKVVSDDGVAEALNETVVELFKYVFMRHLNQLPHKLCSRSSSFPNPLKYYVAVKLRQSVLVVDFAWLRIEGQDFIFVIIGNNIDHFSRFVANHFEAVIRNKPKLILSNFLHLFYEIDSLFV